MYVHPIHKILKNLNDTLIFASVKKTPTTSTRATEKQSSITSGWFGARTVCYVLNQNKYRSNVLKESNVLYPDGEQWSFDIKYLRKPMRILILYISYIFTFFLMKVLFIAR